MVRRAIAALSKHAVATCTKVVVRATAGRFGPRLLRGGDRRRAIRRLIRGLVAGLAGLFSPEPQGVLVPVPVRVRSRRR